jgi:hypothetical protein
MWYLNRIRKSHTDSVINPAWPSIIRPEPRLTEPDYGQDTSLFH